MKRKNIVKKFIDQLKYVEKKSEETIKEKSGEMTKQIERMAKLGGKLYISY